MNNFLHNLIHRGSVLFAVVFGVLLARHFGFTDKKFIIIFGVVTFTFLNLVLHKNAFDKMFPGKWKFAFAITVALGIGFYFKFPFYHSTYGRTVAEKVRGK